MKYFPVYLFLLIFLHACKSEPASDQAVVSGNIMGAKGETIVLEELKTGRLISVDSARLKEQGVFEFSVVPAEKSFYLLKLPGYPPVSMVLDKKDSIILSADTTTFKYFYEVTGNTDAEILQRNYRQTGLAKMVLDSLRQVLFEKQMDDNFPDIKASLDSTLEEIMNQHYENTKQLIQENPGELASLLLINSSISGQLVFSLEKDNDLYQQIEESLVRRYPNNSHVMAHQRRMDAWRERVKAEQLADQRLDPGKQIPSLKLPDVNGVERSLEDFRGENIILMFWVSFLPECRADIQLLKKLYDQNERLNFEIFAVSLDHNEKYWKAAVNLENLEWINVADLSGWQSPVAELFNLKNDLPFYFLIDAKGKIIQKTDDFTILQQSLEAISGSS